ncbi:MAG: class I SAM-dependent methyltransferase [Bryobacteraceae bacterium]|nr:class I SAM-dependent methyltransferase [Bryobacteraceae bacterium]
MARWTITKDGALRYDDPEEHVSSILRVLRIDAETWRSVTREYGRLWNPECRDVGLRVRTLGAAFDRYSPYNLQVPAEASNSAETWERCRICGDGAAEPKYARRIGNEKPPLIYGRCAGCGHGSLLVGMAAPDVYAAASYYTSQGMDGAGYSDYSGEREYRERRGAEVIRWIAARLGRAPKRILEVGSGFGYTRRAAENLGCITFGVDLNPHAVEMARRLYGMSTFAGTLREALAAGAVSPGSQDLALYQFVLEHVDDPAAEIGGAREVLAPGGLLALMLPSMDALEIRAFGGSYRSFRSDHLHLFSRRSLEVLLTNAGFRIVAAKTECSVQLLAGFLTREELVWVDDTLQGPDLIVLAEKKP